MNLLGLPSLLGFQPRYYHGSEIRHYLPLLYDLVATARPKRLMVLGLGDGDAFFTLCQAVRESSLTSECVAAWRGLSSPEEDDAWREGVRYAAEHYREFARLNPGGTGTTLTEFANSKIDLLLIDDCDAGTEILRDLESCEPFLSTDSIVLVHGIGLQRSDSPANAWLHWLRGRPAVAMEAGCGLGIFGRAREGSPESLLFPYLTMPNEASITLRDLYDVAVRRMDAQARAAQASAELAALKARQIWLESLLEDRWKAQETMDEQAAQLKALQFDLDALRRDRAKAQLVMDAQAEQLRQWVVRGETLGAERKQLKATVKEQKQMLNAARKACRKGGRCFGMGHSGEPKSKRSIPTRILRELRRIPGNLKRISSRDSSAQTAVQKSRKVTVVDRYAQWIAAHEPDAAELQRQPELATALAGQPKISLLLPTYNTPVKFLDELFSSLVAQTYGHFEVCVVDGGSSNADTIECLKTWQAKEPRLRVEFLPANLGVAENTNRALTKATGDFLACIDHDDRLPPFALYEVARAIAENPTAEIFYSDEDRLSEAGQRHSPFFKPDWSPEYLLSFMYLGHLTVYQHDLVRRVGRFRPEFDLSQDYDFALRATELAQRIVHIPQVLYHWREHPASGSAGGKPDARKSNLAALGAAMERRNLRAEVIEYPTANRARLTITEWPKVSIIVPTDSAERGKFLVEELPKMTSYPVYEVVIVTNSALADQLETIAPKTSSFRFVRYDKPFNFSDKCNSGADSATGECLIFYNDDVESVQPDWIQNLIEPLENPSVGAVAPKMLYETGKIQHAGLVTAVRGFVGTACHQWNDNSTEYLNFAQSMRDVSALSGACLAMRRKDFFAVGKWDAVNVPVAHSDVDLSFKIRAAGKRCVYTPFVTMRHRGHASIGAEEEFSLRPRRDKVGIFLLKRWPQQTCYDPYFPPHIREWIYADSPEPISMWAPDEVWEAESRGNLLLVSHDLSWSGAPLILLQLAKWLRQQRYFVALMSPVDGPMRKRFVEAGMPVIVDPLVLRDHPSFVQFAGEFDCVIASTIFGAPIVRSAKGAGIPHLWWIHEGRVAEHYLGENDKMRASLGLADFIITPDTKSAQVYQPFTNRPIRVVGYGISDPLDLSLPPSSTSAEQTVRFLLLGTIEYRKGQQVFLNALRRLPNDVLEQARFEVIGRGHDLELVARLRAATQQFPGLIYRESMPHEEALAHIRDADIVISASNDETGPLILMEALALGTPILSTRVGGVAEHLANEDAGIFFPIGDDAALAEAITLLVREPELRARLRAEARSAFERHFTFERFGREFLRVIEEAVGSPRSPARE